MTSKGTKETLVTRLGFKSSSSTSKAEAELEKVRKENVHLRRKIDELAKRHMKPPDSDKTKLLEVKVHVLRYFRLNFRIPRRSVGLPDVACLCFIVYALSCVYFRGFFPLRRCERGTISSYSLESRS